ncbi:major facilitator superfamily domain-containing protein [Penicillium taxi]|uniref:major facilitator superfamily domain-containing protein n=1 Tax=Penicillium taxi TaxID=168475 RepID=UPI0025450988|nr:major facilitator superfamily domain-containing protein [Penicillium taxi]KAJ5894594.1 major facilitator superfamily domain-containing protein [Penicillium taxi]
MSEHSEDQESLLLPNENPPYYRTPYYNRPMEWPFIRKLTIITFVSFTAFNDCIASTISTPNTPQIIDDFNISNASLMSLLISIHIVGLSTGPLIVAPLSEVYGRTPLTHASNFLFVLASVLCAASKTFPTLLFARVLIGLAGSVPITLAPGYIADLVPLENRGKWMTLWSTGYLLGNTIGPVFGGYIGLWKGWRFVFWVEAVISALTALIGLVVMRETFLPVLAGQDPKGKCIESNHKQKNPLRDGLVRSVKIALHSPVLLLVTLFTSAAFVSLYFLITTIPSLFHDQYGFNEGETGLAFIGFNIGFAAGEYILGPLSDWYKNKRTRERGTSRPEDRLALLMPINIIMALGYLTYGWSIQGNMHWVLPVIGTGITAFAIIGVILSAQLYIMDAFGIFAASASSVNIVVRSALATSLPLAAPVMYERLGSGWGNSVLAFVALALVPLSLFLTRHGERFRTSPETQPISGDRYGTFSNEALDEEVLED